MDSSVISVKTQLITLELFLYIRDVGSLQSLQISNPVNIELDIASGVVVTSP